MTRTGINEWHDVGVLKKQIGSTVVYRVNIVQVELFQLQVPGTSYVFVNFVWVVS